MNQTTETAAHAPFDLDEKDTAMVLAKGDTITRFQGMTLDEMEEALKRREEALNRLRTVAIKSTSAIDWTLYKDADGREVGVPRDSAMVNIRKWLGATMTNYRPKNAHGIAEPLVTVIDKPGGGKLTVVEMWADASCKLTGETLEDVYFAARSDQRFNGRTEDGTNGTPPTLQDLKSSCRTGLDSKIVRILSGLRKVDAETLKALGVNVARAYKGSGYGTSAERSASGAAEEGIGEMKEQLRTEILRCVGGDKAQGVALLKEITAYKTKDGAERSYDHVDRLTAKWQIEKALDKLHAHPTWKNISASATPDPAEDWPRE